MANINRIEKRRTSDWIVKLDRDTKRVADEILKERISRGLCPSCGKDREGYKDIFKASFRDKELLNKLKTHAFKKDD